MAIPIPDFLQEYAINLVAEYVTNQLDYVWNYEKKVEELNTVVKKLQEERDRVRDKAEEEEDRYGREIYNDVKVWLGRVDEIISEYEKFGEEDRKHGGYPLAFPNLEARYSRSKIAEDIKEKIGELQQEQHDSISRCQGPPSMGFAFANVDYEPFESRTETVENIRRALEDSSARMIGVHGPSGVGKTTLVIEVANKAWEDKLFNVLIMANVTKSPDIRKIQGQIADMLGMKLEEESEHARAIRIQRRLKKEKENTLIILDDMCAKVDFNMLGIPFPSETCNDVIDFQKNLIPKENKSSADVAHKEMVETKQPPRHGEKEIEKTSAGSSKLKTEERYKGCKVLLISEMRQVLSQMGVKASLIFPVNVLSDKEAETLFRKRAGIVDKNFQLGKVATEISKKCHGLPMSIVTTARALKNQSHSVWEDTRLQLERQRRTGTPEYSTRLSYDLLENEELKLTFLLCARMGHDALIADLVKYCIGLGFLQDIYTVREARDRVQSLLVKLKQSGLMSDSYSSDHFTMQNLVRSAALSIASEDNHVFRLTKGKLDEWPDGDKLERYTDIFFRHCDFIEEFPESIRCPRVRVFQIDNNDPHLKIPDNFFQEMKELRVLILTGIHLSPLPLSIGCLTKLRMLCLEQCTLGEQLCIIGKLKNLRILSFSGSDIKSLPVQLKDLSKLQIFDISNCSKLEEIPPNVISSLTRLEELYMRNTSIEWKVDEGQKNHSENASLSELGHLNQLTNLDLQIQSAADLPKNLFFDKLHNYKIVVGPSDRYLEQDFKMPEKYELVRFLAIKQKDGFDIHSQKEIKMLFERVENLLLEKFSGVQDLFYELNLKGFPFLKHLFIVSNSDIRFLINPKDRKHPEKAFPKLQSLDLYKLKKMEEICSSSCALSKPSFAKLKIIKIKLCSQLKNVFPNSMVRLLTALETIQVSECSSLKEIVHVENTINETEFLKFPELRYLTLQSLYEFTGFHPILQERETKVLFHEKVVVSKLERMELSTIQIDQIWNDQGSHHFENLIHLDVNNCCNLKYLLSLSMAKSLGNLQSLFISECDKMRSIFPQRHSGDGKKDKIFPKLKSIKLSNMKSLSEIWSSEVHVYCFGKLDTLIVEKCNKLVNVFPRYLVGIFRSLGSLRVTNCKSIEAIFDLDNKKRDARDVTRLQDVHLETLPKLKHVLIWKNDQERNFNFNHLQKMYVHNCENLENIFPVSVAKNLGNLEYLVVLDCIGLREIVSKGKGEDTNEDASSSVKFKFPKLTTVKFSKLPKLKRFYPGANKLSCPLLNELSIELCDSLELFREERIDASSGEKTAIAQRKPILFPEKVINKLKSMQIELQHAKSSTRYRRDNLEELRLSRLKKTDIIYSFLHSNPNLKSLWLNDCSFKVLMPLETPAEFESLGVVPKLKSLKLTNLYSLENIGFEQDAILQRIEFLILNNCCELNTIAPSSVSLAHLTSLEVVDCEELKYLMSLSTARSLGQLNTMKVIDCKSLKEIVSEEGSEEGEEENAGKVNIVFKQLKALELVSLKNLESFCNSKSCVFEFPSLEKLVVSACLKMENFSQEVKSTPILQKIYVVHDKEKKRWCWKGNLQATVQYMFENKKFFEGMDRLSVSEHPDLQDVWQGDKKGLQKDWFYNLETLTLEHCKFESYAIPSNVLCCLKRLKELTVWGCDKIEAIFEMNDSVFRRTFQLKKLYLACLPNMTHVWQKDKQGISGFQNLQQVTLGLCEKLETLFPTALARDLRMLEKLEVRHCDELLEIVGKKEEGEAAEKTEKLVFPRLTKLRLNMLPHLTRFCPKMFTLDCPELHTLEVTGCNKLELFQSQQEAHLEGQGSTSITTQLAFSDTKVISKVEHLCLNWKDTLVLWSWLRQLADQELPYLKVINLSFDDDVNGNSTLPCEVLDKTPNLEKMVISNCKSIKEIFPTQNPKIGNGMLGNLKQLNLFELYELHSISGLEHMSKLQLLTVSGCHRLRTLAGQSCSNLKVLSISKCDGLPCLITSRAAKELTQLEEMYVYNCESMKEIVGKEQDEIEEIKFERLEKISLRSLSRLECFYSGEVTLQLPSLIQVEIVRCRKMKIFSHGLISAESFRGIQVSYDRNEELVFHDNLNSSLKMLYLYQERLVLGDYPELEENWLGSAAIPGDGSFSKLKYLEVDGCEFLSDGILPSHLLPLLNNLKELHVRKCDRAKAIFDMKDTPTHDLNMTVTIPLKRMTLEQLPTLKHVWNKDPKGSISFPFLKKVIVNECKSMKSLLPAPVTKDQQEELDVRNREKLVEGCELLSSALLPSHLLPFLSHLEKLEIRKCDCVEEIFDVKCTPAHDSNMIVIPLKRLILEELPTLRDVWNKDPKGSLSLPFLEEVVVNECKSIKRLLPASVAKDNLQKLDVRSCVELVEIVAKDEATIEDANKEVSMFPKLTSLKLGDLPNLRCICSGMQILDLLEVEDSELSSNAILPSHLLPCLSNLEELVVRKCDSFEAIFDVKYTSAYDSNMTVTIPLKRMTLEQLPTLRHVWNKDPKGSLILTSLEEVTVNECKTIKSLFPASIAKDNLQKLEVRNCMELVEIVAIDEAATEEANTELAMFPKLTLLALCDLPNLRCICSGMQILDWPMLKDLNVYHCENLKLFASDFQNSPCSYPEVQDRIATENHGIVSAEKVIPHLVKLSLNKEDVIMIVQGLLYVDLKKIKTLGLQSFNDESDAFPDDFFSKVPLPKLEEFGLIDSAFKEIFHPQRPDTDYTKILSQLKKLELRSLHKLKSIGLEHTWMAPLVENLKVLEVLECSCLTNLAPSTVSLSRLTRLKVEGCARLEYLFTSSTAGSLVALDEMSISNCESLQTVVAHEEGDKPDKYVIFPELWDISLSKLPNLGSFYTGESTLKFRWLFNVSIAQCKSMKTFSYGNVVAHKLWRLDIGGANSSNDDLNTAVHQQFEKGSCPDIT